VLVLHLVLQRALINSLPSRSEFIFILVTFFKIASRSIYRSINGLTPFNFALPAMIAKLVGNLTNLITASLLVRSSMRLNEIVTKETQMKKAYS
jgi:hypothetical protein